jgi:flagellar hook assembly protein FlgD
VAVLLAATAVAFVVTERLKLTPSPILGTRVDKLFSPVCECGTSVATISFRLRDRDDVSLQIVDGKGEPIRELTRREPKPRRQTLVFFWDGRDDLGEVVPEGVYRPRVQLARERRTIVLPNPIRVDVSPPRVRLVSLSPRVFSPDGDGRRDRVVARYRVDEPARVSLYVDGVRRTLKKGRKQQATVDWNGRIDGASVPSGAYRLELGATDLAGNVGRLTRAKSVTVRYVALGRDRILVRPGGRIRVRVAADAASFSWRLGRRTGRAKPGLLRLRAPLQPGRFTLTVTVGEHSARAAVFVRRPGA